jgi:energy-coupling factor transporter ATP-binding protein EcfA2
MIPDPQPLMILDAMTLRGIGSYLHGARLDIKPLTILCGANGSGKSTWLKALNWLEDSLKANRFPFAFAVEDWSPQNIQVTNAFYHLADPEQFQFLEGPNTTRDFGSPGTIGMEFHATCNFRLTSGEPSDQNRESAWRFLNIGSVKANDRFRLRFAHPTHLGGSTPTPELLHVVELQLNNRHTIRLEGERDPLEKYEEGSSRPRRSKPYTLSCSKSFLTGSDDDADELIDVAIFHDLITPRYEPLTDLVDADAIPQLLDRFVSRLCKLLQTVLDGFFYVGAIRPAYTSLTLDKALTDTAQKERYVGPNGENAWRLEKTYGSHRMRRIANPTFDVEEAYLVALWLAGAVRRRESDAATKPTFLESKLLHLWGHLPLGARQESEAFLTADGYPSPSPAPPQLLAEALNELLDDRTFFDREVFLPSGEDYPEEYHEEDYDEEGNLIGPEPEDLLDRDIAILLELGIEQLPAEYVRVLNYLLILVDTFQSRVSTSQQCRFTEYLSCWLQQLVRVGLNPEDKTGGEWKQSSSLSHTRLGRPTPFWIPFRQSGTIYLGDDDWTTAGMSRLDHPCFGGNRGGALQPPRQLSAGFHQIFPLLVQLGLMQSGELLGIENPEVHLHPSLQIRLTEALLDHAVSGRRIIVETHSDLVVRRVIRAFLEEEIAQSQVQIYFAELEEEESPLLKSGFHSSKLEPIQTDSRGRIANWPEGFLDADVRESQRLMDIMYGHEDEEEDDDAF